MARKRNLRLSLNTDDDSGNAPNNNINNNNDEPELQNEKVKNKGKGKGKGKDKEEVVSIDANNDDVRDGDVDGGGDDDNDENDNDNDDSSGSECSVDADNQTCHRCQRHGLLTLCDHCELGFHSKCLKPTEAPIDETDLNEVWSCPVCTKTNQASSSRNNIPATNTTTTTTTTATATTTTTTTVTAAVTARAQQHNASAAGSSDNVTTTTTTVISTGRRGVRGPRSALTSFLEEKGISATGIRERYLNQYQRRREPNQTEPQEEGLENNQTSESRTVADEIRSRKRQAFARRESNEKEKSKSKRIEKDKSDVIDKDKEKTRKRKKKGDKKLNNKKRKTRSTRGGGGGGGGDGDDDDESSGDSDSGYDVNDDDEEEDSSIYCVICKRPLPSNMSMGDVNPAAPTCSLCSSIIAKRQKSRNSFSKKKGRNVNVTNGAIQQTVTIEPLHLLCAKFIGKNIENVQSFGVLNSNVRNAICSVLCKQRMLNDDTFRLFMEHKTNSLTLYDCAKLSYDSLKSIGQEQPGLQKLKLEECGRFDDFTLGIVSRCCPKLNHFSLHGSHLVSDESLESFVKTRKAPHELIEFEVSFNPNVHLKTFSTLSKCRKLRALLFVHCSKVDDECFEKLQDVDKLVTLNIQGLGISDKAFSILNRVNPLNFRELTILKCDNISEEQIPALTAVVNNLTYLKLDYRILPNPNFLTTLNEKLSLEKLHLHHCTELTDDTWTRFLTNNCKTLVEISINEGLLLSKKSLLLLSSCSELKKLDVSWCREIDNEVIVNLVSDCTNLEEITIWGCHRLNENIFTYTKGRCNIVGAMFV